MPPVTFEGLHSLWKDVPHIQLVGAQLPPWGATGPCRQEFQIEDGVIWMGMSPPAKHRAGPVLILERMGRVLDHDGFCPVLAELQGPGQQH